MIPAIPVEIKQAELDEALFKVLHDSYYQRKKSATMVELLVAHKANPNLDRGKWPMLHLAARRLDIASCEVLLQAGADPEARDFRGKTVVEDGDHLGKDFATFVRGYVKSDTRVCSACLVDLLI